MTKKCTCCGRVDAWEAFRLLGRENYGVDGTVEYRNCSCGSTLGVRVEGPRESRPPGSSRDAQFAVVE